MQYSEKYPAKSAYPAEKNFFISSQWFELLWKHVYAQSGNPLPIDAAGARLHCLILNRDRGILRSLTNYYTMEFSPSGTTNDEDVECRIIENALEADVHGLSLQYLDPESKFYKSITEELKRRRWILEVYEQHKNWVHQVSEKSFEEYFDARPSKLKNTWKRKKRQAEKAHTILFAMYKSNDGSLELGIKAWQDVYAKSWKKPEKHPTFISDLIRLAADVGVLRLGVLSVDSSPVAAQLWITTASKALIYKLAYDEAFKKESFGTLLSHEMFRVAIDEDCVHEIDYGIGDDAYKRDWMTVVKSVKGLLAFNPKTPKGLVGGGGVVFRRLLRKVRTKPE